MVYKLDTIEAWFRQLVSGCVIDEVIFFVYNHKLQAKFFKSSHVIGFVAFQIFEKGSDCHAYGSQDSALIWQSIDFI